MRTGRPTQPLNMTTPERETLQAWARRRKTSQQLALRSRIVLLCDDGMTNTEVSRKLHIAMPTVGKWRERFRVHRLEGLTDEPRPGAPRTVSDTQVENVIVRTLESTPPNATHWSTRSMASATGLSQSTIVRIWRAFGLQPHRVETFKLSTDPQFIEKVRDIVGLYLNPPDKAMVLCIDEKSQVQALDRSQPLLPMRPGQAERRTHDYVRHGTTSLFAALDAATGKVVGKCHRRHRHQEFLSFMQWVDEHVPRTRGMEVHLILDNDATHKTPRVRRWFAKRPYYRLHFTPTSASWLNLVERFFAELTTKRVRRGVFRSTRQLERAIMEYLDHHNTHPKPFSWTSTADDILKKIKRFCERTSDSGH